MKLRYAILVFLALFVACETPATPKAAYHWNLLHDGIVYAKYSFKTGEEKFTTIHAFQIDPAKVRFDIVVADKQNTQGMTAKDLAQKNKAALVINGGFFTEERKSIGLLIQNGRVINPIHRTSWWSIFGVEDGKPFIVSPKNYKLSSMISMAVQVGPRLVIDGAIPKLKASIADRSAVGINKEGKIILVITEGSPVSMKEIARRMRDNRFHGGLECVNAMALDGGSSTQLYAKIGGFELSLPGRSTVPNGIAVYTK